MPVRSIIPLIAVCRAKEAGIVILNEIGLDPGIDHLTAMSTIDSVLEQGGQVCVDLLARNDMG
jgi:saccharopine dehydrogenase-like NADP-dependent oxidoreductase